MFVSTRATVLSLLSFLAVTVPAAAGLACGGASGSDDSLPDRTLVGGADNAAGEEGEGPAVDEKSAEVGSELDRAIVREINTLREDPRGYVRYLKELRSFYRGKRVEKPGEVAILTFEGVAAVDEAISVLSRTKPLPPLKSARGLHLAARDHAADVGPRGSLDHTGRDGSTPHKRMQRYGQVMGLSGENMDFGFDSARDVILHLVVDDGVSNRGHRVNLLETAFRFVGVACGPHKQFGTVCVMDFAEGYRSH